MFKYPGNQKQMQEVEMAASSRQEQEHTGLQLPINSVKSLLLNPFERRTLTERLCINELGPEKPGLHLTQQTHEKDKVYQRSFSLNWYDRKAWLTGLVLCRSRTCRSRTCRSRTCRSNERIFSVNEMNGITSWTDSFLSQLSWVQPQSCRPGVELPRLTQRTVRTWFSSTYCAESCAVSHSARAEEIIHVQ